MPLTKKGETIKAALVKEYGEERGERILYAGKNKGTFTGIDAARDDAIRSYHDAARRGDSAGMDASRTKILKR